MANAQRGQNRSGQYKKGSRVLEALKLYKEYFWELRRGSHTTWQQMKGKGFLHPIDGDNDRMSCVVPAGTSSTNIDIGCEDINELPFALIPPLRAQNNCDYLDYQI